MKDCEGYDLYSDWHQQEVYSIAVQQSLQLQQLTQVVLPYQDLEEKD